MEFEWDEQKRFKNIEKHGFDFINAKTVFENPHIMPLTNCKDGEQRLFAAGLVDEVYVTVVYTLRGSVIRIISMRKSRDGERRKHQEVYGS